jgi:hypothetical protein
MRFKLFAASSLVAVAAVVAALVGTASGARGPAAAGSSMHAAKMSPSKTLATLYSNTTNDSGIGIVSQNFESDFDAYDSQGADDFTVPTGHKWTIKQVTVGGQYFNGSGPARDLGVWIYSGGSLPGSVVKSYSNVHIVQDNAGSFTFKLKKAKLGAGHYWISVQANMDFGVGGEWGWESSLNSVGNNDVWQNPGGGFGIGCTTYTDEQTCIPDGQGPSKILVLQGSDKAKG